MRMKNPELIIYGGAFDPPHRGHVDCVEGVRAAFPSSLIMVIPGLKPAGAGGFHKDPCLNFDIRFELCRLAFLVDFGHANLEISSVETSLPVPNFTINTIERIHDLYPLRSLGIVMGLDQFGSFAVWHRPKDIIGRSHLILVRRGTDEGLKHAVDVQMAKLGYKVRWTSPKMAEIEGMPFGIYIIDIHTSLASSTKIRDYLSKNEKVPEGWLSPSVEQYIRMNGLYLKKG
ncbi:MAG: nicotinate-nicotinamide nucleotide adenylyltransferase [Oligoflexales bacterium]|nr:nicotinate-nicotinamide nucleotide adenylyltransferase [Oligoflexales bacterium]